MLSLHATVDELPPKSFAGVLRLVNPSPLQVFDVMQSMESNYCFFLLSSQANHRPRVISWIMSGL